MITFRNYQDSDADAVLKLFRPQLSQSEGFEVVDTLHSFVMDCE